MPAEVFMVLFSLGLWLDAVRRKATAPFRLAFTGLGAALTTGLLVWAAGGLLPGRWGLSGSPFWAQVAAGVVLADLALYWQHRMMHLRAFWRFHAAHHEPRRVTWMTQQRRHAVDSLLSLLAPVAPLALAGIGWREAALALMMIEGWGYVIHMRLRLRLPVLVTPEFHHLHHARDPACMGCNFGVLLPFDRLFGTAKAPGRTWPETGIGGEA